VKVYLAGQIPIMLLILQSGLAELPPNAESVDSFLRLDAVHKLVSVEATEEDRQFLYATLSDPEPFIRRMSVRALGNTIHEDNCQPLYDRLKVESVS
jgi:HEAT repeat protein